MIMQANIHVLFERGTNKNILYPGILRVKFTKAIINVLYQCFRDKKLFQQKCFKFQTNFIEAKYMSIMWILFLCWIIAFYAKESLLICTWISGMKWRDIHMPFHLMFEKLEYIVQDWVSETQMLVLMLIPNMANYLQGQISWN